MTLHRELGLQAGLFLIFVSASIYFASVQSIWVDETTQLSGLALPLGDRIAWLAGRHELVEGFPPDRMPPLSYVLGGLWATVFGLSEASMRVFGIVCVLVGVPAVALAARHVGGPVGGLLASAMMLLSPFIVTQAVEIRAYPLFLAFSAWVAWAYVRVLDPPRSEGDGWRLFGLCLLLLLAAYTHFYGVVLAGSILGALVLLRALEGEGVWRCIAFAGATAVGMLGLLPFIFAAGDVGAGSGGSLPDIGGVASDAARLAVRLFTHAAHLATPSTIAVALALIGAGALLISAAWRGFACWREEGRQRLLGIGLALPLAIGSATLLMAAFVAHEFKVLAPHYNLWMVPFVAILCAYGFGSPSVIVRSVSWAGGALISTAYAASMIVFLSAPRLYSHGPGEWIADDLSSSLRALVLHDSTGQWGHVYFPVLYLTKGQVRQVLVEPDGSTRLITPRGLEESDSLDSMIADSDLTVAVFTRGMSAVELAQVFRGGDCSAELPLKNGDKSIGKMETSNYCAFIYSSRVTILE